MFTSRFRSIASSLVALGLTSGALLGSGAPDPQPVPEDDARLQIRWGVALETNEIYYQEGETAHARLQLVNRTDDDAYGYVLVKGGNGCQYRGVLLDENGATVWEPGSIYMGMFTGPGCLFGSGFWSLPADSNERRRFDVPLIYQNRDGNGTLGDPLPPGLYTLKVDVYFGGPQTAPNPISFGGRFGASVPIVIEAASPDAGRVSRKTQLAR